MKKMIMCVGVLLCGVPLCAMENGGETNGKEPSFDFDNALKRQESLKQHEEEKLDVLLNTQEVNVQEDKTAKRHRGFVRIDTQGMEIMLKKMREVQDSGVSLQPLPQKEEDLIGDEPLDFDAFDKQLRTAQKSHPPVNKSKQWLLNKIFSSKHTH